MWKEPVFMHYKLSRCAFQAWNRKSFQFEIHTQNTNYGFEPTLTKAIFLHLVRKKEKKTSNKL